MPYNDGSRLGPHEGTCGKDRENAAPRCDTIMGDEARNDQAVAGWVWTAAALGLFAVAALTATVGFPFVPPIAEPTVVLAGAVDPTPVRRPTLQPTYEVGVFTYLCSDCHRIIPSPSETDRRLTQHREVQLRHGLNTRCFNCHHRENRDAFVDDYGNAIAWSQPQLLCAKCHGTVYRDWQAGAHGRTGGTWDAARGTQTRLRCIDCHDPHNPPFGSLAPAPAPHTLRQGRQDFGPAHDGGNPLRRSGRPSAGSLAAPHTPQDEE